jgi:DNA invertase Pin-like site-specific DNA recombinase
MRGKQAISYIRFSSDRQRGGSSVERQESMIVTWLSNHPDFTLSDLKFKDLGKSGYHGKHIEAGGGFGKLLIAIEEGVIRAGDVVLVEALDRAGRLEPLDMLTLIIAPILKAGVSIITLDDDMEYTKASVGGTQIFLLVAKIQAAHGYSQALARRVSDSYESRRAKAKSGVTPKRMTPVWLNSDGTVRDDVAPWIKLAFELYVDGVGKATIAKRMRESGVERLKKCSGPGVEGWLRNKAVIGKWETLPGTPDHQIIDDVYPLIIEPALFYKAQIRAEQMKTIRPVKTAAHFLVGLVRCGSCGKNYIIQNKNGVPHSMRCRTRQNLKGCDNSHIVPKPVMDAIYSYTSVRAARQAVAQQQMGVNEKEIISREAELMALAKKVENLALTVSEVGPMPEIIAALKQAQREREIAEKALILLRVTVVPPAAHGWKEIGEVWKLEKEDPQRLAAMLRTVGYSITVNADGRITSSHSSGVYRYAGVDRREDKYKLMADSRLILVTKNSNEDYPYWEPFDSDEPAESVWTDEDYAYLQRQYE